MLRILPLFQSITAIHLRERVRHKKWWQGAANLNDFTLEKRQHREIYRLKFVFHTIYHGAC